MNRHLPAADVGVFDSGEVVYVAPLPEGPIVVLSDTAAAAWRTIASDSASSPGDEAELDRYRRAFAEAGLIVEEG